MYSTSKQNDDIAYNLKEFICDTQEDIHSLPVNCAPGSTAFVVATSEVYMLNNKNEWINLNK